MHHEWDSSYFKFISGVVVVSTQNMFNRQAPDHFLIQNGSYIWERKNGNNSILVLRCIKFPKSITVAKNARIWYGIRWYPSLILIHYQWFWRFKMFQEHVVTGWFTSADMCQYTHGLGHVQSGHDREWKHDNGKVNDTPHHQLDKCPI